MTETVVRLPDDDAVAERVAADVVARLAQVQAEGRVASLVLTGGTISRTVHAALARRSDELDWARVEVWWGDERYVPAADPERNAGQARADLLDRVPVEPVRVHEMPASESGHDDVGAAAAAYDAELRSVLEGRGGMWFDVLMLGIGPDGHCASLFPGRPEVTSPELVLPVTGSPKPPPERVSLGMAALRAAAHVMFVATGEAKAEAVAGSVRGEDVEQVPSAGPRGTVTTTWYVDEAAGSATPR
jgi:6-phosphogluconolactonase